MIPSPGAAGSSCSFGRALQEFREKTAKFLGTAAEQVDGAYPGVSPAGASPHFSPDFVARRRRRAWIQGARREDAAGVLDSCAAQ
jgi:hypothetical protein